MLKVDFADFIWAGVVIGIIVSFFIASVTYFFVCPGELRSKTPIQPRIELIIKDNKVDTLYIYSND